MPAKRRRIERSPSAYAVQWRNSHKVYVTLAEFTAVPGSPPVVRRWSATAHAHVDVDCPKSVDFDTAIREAAPALGDVVFEPVAVRHATTTLTFMRGETVYHRTAVNYLMSLVCWR